ncbi:MAG: hypothetical protein IPN86_02395 [Saprospiraceae bacterium]|nr:hypothetical protein [Saprospiraceae bacterium]
MSVAIFMNTGCKINKAYTNGQEGLETVYEKGQLNGEVDIFGADGAGGLHASANYSPIKNLAILYDHKSALLQHQYHTLAIGGYWSDYKKLDLVQASVSKPTIDIGRHLDFYTGMSYGYTKNSLIYVSTNTNVFPPLVYDYELTYHGKRYFAQLGGHVKAKYLGFDIVYRRVWLDPDKIEIFGLGPDNEIDALGSFTNPGYRPYSEFSLKMNFVGTYKPFYLGFSVRYGDDTQFTQSAFSSRVIFCGVNKEIYHLFTKKAPKRTDLEYIFEE